MDSDAARPTDGERPTDDARQTDGATNGSWTFGTQ